MKNIICFTIRTDRKNWTPADLMRDYAKANNYKIETTKYFETIITIDGKQYKYDHIKNHHENPVTVYLVEA